MPAFISGIPLHPLVVHAVVVLVPLAVLGTLTIALWPAARRRYGWLVVVLTAVATACIPIATSSGEQLERRLVSTELIRRHTHLGGQLLVFVVGLLVVTTALVWIDHRHRRDVPGAAQNGPPAAITIVLVVLVVALGIVSGVQVVRIGDSGARAVWTQRDYTAVHPEQDD